MRWLKEPAVCTPPCPHRAFTPRCRRCWRAGSAASFCFRSINDYRNPESYWTSDAVRAGWLKVWPLSVDISALIRMLITSHKPAPVGEGRLSAEQCPSFCSSMVRNPRGGRRDRMLRGAASFDRGANIRFDSQCFCLLREHFTCVESQVANNFNRIPWVHILLTAVR